jgi:Flp pilus assembly protein TadD
MQRRQFAQAVSACDLALAICPNSLEALRCKGAACLLGGMAKDAVPVLRRALELRPDDFDLVTNLGLALQDCGALPEAITWLRLAAQRPDIENLMNLSAALRAAWQLDEAVACCERALALDAANGPAYENLGNALCDAGRIGLSIACYERAVRLLPDELEPMLSLAHSVLLAGDLQRGWPLNEVRFRRESARQWPGLPPSLPRWDGSTPERGLLLVAEQGLGDTIQFARYGKMLREHRIRPILQCQRRLVRLMSDSGLFEAVIPAGSPPGDAVGAWYPLMSLPLAFDTALTSVPAPVPYLQAEPELLRTWRARVGQRTAFRVGIAWQGNPLSETGHLRGRSAPLREFAPLMAVPGVEFICLQKGPGLEQRDAVGFAERLAVPSPELDSGEHGFIDSAALVALVDLVITTDSALAHLAGAMGRPVWLALNFAPDWRWLLARVDSPWYPTMRIFRQERPQDWSSVFRAMSEQLYHQRAP